MSVTQTFAPAMPNARAIPHPKPRAAPVTRATLFFSSIVVRSLRFIVERAPRAPSLWRHGDAGSGTDEQERTGRVLLQGRGDVAEIEPVPRPHLDAKHHEGVFAVAYLVGNRTLGRTVGRQ